MSEASQLAQRLLEAEPGSFRDFFKTVKRPIPFKQWIVPLGFKVKPICDDVYTRDFLLGQNWRAHCIVFANKSLTQQSIEVLYVPRQQTHYDHAESRNVWKPKSDRYTFQQIFIKAVTAITRVLGPNVLDDSTIPAKEAAVKEILAELDRDLAASKTLLGEAEPGSARAFLKSMTPPTMRQWLEPMGLHDMGTGKRFCSDWYPLKTPWKARLEVGGDMRHRYSLAVVWKEEDDAGAQIGNSHVYRNISRPSLKPEDIRKAITRTITVLLQFLTHPPESRAGFVKDVLINLDLVLDSMEETPDVDWNGPGVFH